VLFYSLLRQHLRSACPSNFHRAKGEEYPFTDSDLTRFADLWWHGTLFWESATPEVNGFAFLGNVHKHTEIVHIFQSERASDDDCRSCLIKLATALRAEYAFVHALPDEVALIRPIDQMLGGATARQLPQWLPGIPWAVCYGQPYLDFFGKDKLLSLPVHETREICSDMVYCQLTGHLLDAVEDTGLIDERRKPIYDHLGRDAFFDPQYPNRQGHAPEFKKPIVVRP
jgi:hypothetical protein